MRDRLKADGPVLAVVAHPDDEVLGCGGVLARHASVGDDVHILIVAQGGAARDGAGDAEARRAEQAILQDAARRAAAALGLSPPAFVGLPDNRLDSVDLLDIVKTVEAAVAEWRPRVVYTHHGGDLNIDHRIVHQAVVTACRPLPGCPVQAVYTFETPSSTEWASASIGDAFRPSRFVDVTAQMPAKRAALEAYEYEMRPFPHARSIEAVEALARWRGAGAGTHAAEAFMVVHERL